MIDNSGDNTLVEELGLQMDDLRGDHQDILAEVAERTDLQTRMNDMNSFLEEMSAAITEYSEALTRRLIEKITIFDEKIVVELKSSLQVEVEKKRKHGHKTKPEADFLGQFRVIFIMQI